MKTASWCIPSKVKAYKPELSGGDAYANEVVDFIDCINEGRESTVNTAESVLQTLKIAFAEMESAEKGEKVYV